MRWFILGFLFGVLPFQPCLPNTLFLTSDSSFIVASLPGKLKYSKKLLNKEIAKATSSNQVRKIILSKHFTAARIVVIVLRSGKSTALWTLQTQSPKEITVSYMDYISRGNALTKFNNLGDFKRFFTDTLVLLDTLRIDLNIPDPGYTPGQYQLSIHCGGREFTRPFPNKENQLYLNEQLIAVCEPRYASLMIFHASNPDHILANCRVRFLNLEAKTELEAVARGIKAAYPAMETKHINLMLESFIFKNYGRPYFPQLADWTTKL
jgi:hypothetical protein